jgi:hypothetical protein
MNRRRSRQIVDIVSESNVIKIFVAFVFGIVFLILSPIVILTMPFIYAWHLVDIVFERKNKMESFSLFQSPSKWGGFEVDFSSWKKNADGEW